MRLDRLGLIHKDQRGLTFVELMIAIVLAGIVTAGITMTFAHLFSGSTRTSNHMTAVRQVQSAGYWVSQDALQAQEEPVIGENPATNFLTLTWTDSATGNNTTVIYTLVDMPSGESTRLQRRRSVEGVTTETGVIAQFLDSTQTECAFVGGVLRFEVTATVGGQSETRVYEVKPRPG